MATSLEDVELKERKRWWLLVWGTAITVVLIFLAFTVYQIKSVPPIPQQVQVQGTNNTLYTKDDIIKGKEYFQEFVLMDNGTILGNGAYTGPDYTAWMLHLLVQSLENIYANEKYHAPYAALTKEQKVDVDYLVKRDLREMSTLKSPVTTVTPEYTKAFEQAKDIIVNFIVNGNPRYAWLGHIVPKDKAEKIVDFVNWTTLAATTNRPGSNITYTNNWPPEPKIGLGLTFDDIWTSLIAFMGTWVASIVVIFIFYEYFEKLENAAKPVAALDIAPLTNMQKKVLKYVPIVPVFFFLQCVFGGYLAHLYADPTHNWLIPQSLLPFNVARQFHLNLAVLWIAIGWLAGGLFIAPLASGRKDFKLPILVDILWLALVVVGVGGLIGIYLGTEGYLQNDKLWFWLGSQGREYLELGRIWATGVLIGLVIWFVIVLFTIRQAKKITPSLNVMMWSAFAIAGLYIAALLPFTHIIHNYTIDDYFRWWVVHLWVENTFELFAAGTLAFITVELGLVNQRFANAVMFFEMFLIIGAGTIGTGHHYYWMGEDNFWIMWGSILSSLEPVPLVMLMVEAYREYRHIQNKDKFHFNMTFYWLGMSAFLNWFGAGFYGMFINEPAVNYFTHGTYFVMAHSHVALLGAFGYIAIAFIYFILEYRAAAEGFVWDMKLSKLAFWLITIGICLYTIPTMVIGFHQFKESFDVGYWYARTRSVLEPVHFWMWIRILPDSMVLGGAFLLMVDILYKLFMPIKKIEKAA